MNGIYLAAAGIVMGAVLLVRLVSMLRNARHWKLSCSGPVNTLVILGSGGHTAEITTLLDKINRSRYQPMHFILADTDSSSEVRVRRTEEAKGNLDNCKFWKIPRAREVGQSWVTTVFTTLYSILHSLVLVLRIRPDVVITNGPGTCIPVCYSAFLFHLIGLKQCKIIFIESFCRVDTLSMSGKLLYPVASRFLVQWQKLVSRYPKSEYIGRLL